MRQHEATLGDAISGADVFLGLSAACANPEWCQTMAPKPIIFAMANPDPEISARGRRRCAPMRSSRPAADYPNQVNNVLGFPSFFAERSTFRRPTIDEAMKIAAAEAWPSSRARTGARGSRRRLRRSLTSSGATISFCGVRSALMEVVASAVAEAAVESGVAQGPIADMDAYRHQLEPGSIRRSQS